MKFPSLLTISLCANCVLLAVAGFKSLSRDIRAPEPIHRIVRMTPAQASTFPGKASRRPPVEGVIRTSWDAVESGDHRQFIANLRAAGCPEQTIRDILLMRVSREFFARYRTEEEDRLRQWDWRPLQSFTQRNAGARRRQAFLDEKDSLLKDLVGESFQQMANTLMGWPRAEKGRSYLPPERRNQLRELDERYRDLTERIRDIPNALNPALLDDDQMVELAALEKQKRAEMVQLLTPEELEALDARESPAARYVLDNLPEARSEAEFRHMVKAVEETGLTSSRHGFEPDLTVEVQTGRYQTEQAALEQGLNEVLGDDYLAQRREEDAARRLAEGEREGRKLFEAIAVNVGASSNDANRFLDWIIVKSEELRTQPEDSSLTAKQRQELETKMEAEAERVAVEIMGEKGRDFLKRLIDEPR